MSRVSTPFSSRKEIPKVKELMRITEMVEEKMEKVEKVREVNKEEKDKETKITVLFITVGKDHSIVSIETKKIW